MWSNKKILGAVVVALIGVAALSIPPLASWHTSASGTPTVSDADKARVEAIATWVRREHFEPLEWEPEAGVQLVLGPLDCPEGTGLPVGLVAWERGGRVAGAAVVFRSATPQNAVDLRRFETIETDDPMAKWPAGVLAVRALGMK